MSSNSRSNAVLATFSTAGFMVVVVSTFVLRIVTVQIEVGLGTG